MLTFSRAMDHLLQMQFAYDVAKTRESARDDGRFSGSLTGRPSQIRGKEAKIFRYAAAFCWPGAEVGVVSCVVAGILSADCGLFSDAAAA